MYRIVFEKQALKDLDKLKAANISNKAKILIDIMKEDPCQNPPRYEKLVGNLDGLYARRINIQHRLVYQVYNAPITMNDIEYQGSIKIIRMRTHCDKIRHVGYPLSNDIKLP